MRTRSEAIAAHVAAAIIRNSRKHWRSLHCDAVTDTERELIKMAANQKSSCTTTNLTVGDNEQKRTPVGRLGTDDPKTLSAEYGRKEADVTTSSPTAPATPASGANTRPAGMVSQMNCDPHTLGVVIRPVDRKTITGSTPGDHRSRPGDTAAASVRRVTDNGGPRQPMGQFKNSKNAPDKPGFQSTVMTTGEETGD